VNDVWSIAGWNIFFTSIPILIVACLERDVSAEASLKCPKLYIQGQKDVAFNYKVFILENTYAFATSIVCYFCLYYPI
jgi:hypothetical protein